MAGVLAKLSEWRSLESAWKKRLRASPRMEYLHVNEIDDRRVEGTSFYGLTKKEADRKLAQLRRLVWEHTEYRALAWFRLEEFYEVFPRERPLLGSRRLNSRYAHPYVIAYLAALDSTYAAAEAIDGRQKPPLITFHSWSDSKRESKATELFRWLQQTPEGEGPAWLSWVRDSAAPPVFMPSGKGHHRNVGPQVADAVVTKMREVFEAAELGERVSIPRLLGSKIAYRRPYGIETLKEWREFLEVYVPERRKGGWQ